MFDLKEFTNYILNADYLNEQSENLNSQSNCIESFIIAYDTISYVASNIVRFLSFGQIFCHSR